MNTSYAMLDHGLGEDLDMLRDLVYKFSKSEIAPRAAEIDKENEFPADLWRKMGDLGILGITVAEEFGGSNMGYLAHVVVMEEISRASASVGLSYGAHSNLCVNQIHTNGSADQKTKYLPQLCSGEHVGALAMSEPDAGSDPGSMLSNAKKVEGGYKLNGSKTWITNAPIADVFVIWAKDEQGVLRGFIAKKDFAGLDTKVLQGKFALRASTTGQIFMSDVFIPEEYVLPLAQSFRGPFSCLNIARYGIAWGSLGAAEFCWHAARQYTLDRIQFGSPLAAKQLVQKKLADMQTEITLGLQAALRVGRLIDEGEMIPEMISLIKRNNCGKALDVARLARDMHGGNGVIDEYHVVRHSMNLEAVNTYEGTHDIHALILGNLQTDIAAFE